MEKYYLNNIDVQTLIDQYFPVKSTGIKEFLDESSLNESNLNNFIVELNYLLNDVYVEKTENEQIKLDDLDVSLGSATDKLKELFSDDNLVIYGHGGAAEKIMDDGHFKCQYPELSSHFLPLSWSESLSALNSWGHRDANQIMILALNKNEVNPIYKDLKESNSYSAFQFEIPLEYFAGYYDRDKKEFVPNSGFKREHDFNPELTISAFNTIPHGVDNKSQDAVDFYGILDKLVKVFFFSRNGLSKKGYDGLKQQVNYYEKMLQDKLKDFINSKATSEMLDELENTEDPLDYSSNMNTFDDESWVNDDIDWGVEDSAPKL